MNPVHFPSRDFPFTRTSRHIPPDASMSVQAQYVTGILQDATPAHKIALLRHLIDLQAAGKHYEQCQYDSVWTGFETQHRLLQVATYTGTDLDAIRRAALAMVEASLPLHLSQQYEALKGEAARPLEAFEMAQAATRDELQRKLHAIEVHAQKNTPFTERLTGIAMLYSQPQPQPRDLQNAPRSQPVNASSSPAPEDVPERAAAPGSVTGMHFPLAATQTHYTLTVRRENALPYAVNDGMHRYRQRFLDRSEAQGRLYSLFGNEEPHFASDLQAFCAMPAVFTQKMVFERELETREGRAHFSTDLNEAVLGNASAAMRDLLQARVPGNQLALLMRVPMWTGQGQPRDIEKEFTANPLILSVCAPALDESDEPEWGGYVDPKGALKADAYMLAMATIAEQVVEAALRYPDHKVVLAAFGMNNYLSGLKDPARAEAFAIGVANMQALIAKLAGLNRVLGYTDGTQDSPFWEQVNRGLTTAIGYEGRVPGTWITGKTMIVNAWDPCSLVGNGCKADNSMDGYVGRSSLVHEAHAHAILSWRHKLLDWQ